MGAWGQFDEWATGLPFRSLEWCGRRKSERKGRTLTTWTKFGRVIGNFVVAVARGAGVIAAFTVLAMCLLVTFDVFVRGVFDLPIAWVPEIVGYLMVILVFFSLADTMLADDHIKVDLLVNRMPTRFREIAELFTLSLSTVIAGLFTWHGVNTALRSYEFGLKDAFGVLGVPLYVPQLALPIGSLVLTLVMLVLVVRKLRIVFGSAESAGADYSLEDRHSV